MFKILLAVTAVMMLTAGAASACKFDWDKNKWGPDKGEASADCGDSGGTFQNDDGSHDDGSTEAKNLAQFDQDWTALGMDQRLTQSYLGHYFQQMGQHLSMMHVQIMMKIVSETGS